MLSQNLIKNFSKQFTIKHMAWNRSRIYSSQIRVRLARYVEEYYLNYFASLTRPDKFPFIVYVIHFPSVMVRSSDVYKRMEQSNVKTIGSGTFSICFPKLHYTANIVIDSFLLLPSHKTLFQAIFFQYASIFNLFSSFYPLMTIRARRTAEWKQIDRCVF